MPCLQRFSPSSRYGRLGRVEKKPLPAWQPELKATCRKPDLPEINFLRVEFEINNNFNLLAKCNNLFLFPAAHGDRVSYLRFSALYPSSAELH